MLGLFGVVALGVGVPFWFGPLGEDPGPRLGLLVLAGGAWAASLLWSRRWLPSKRNLGCILVGAVLLRGLALLGTPGTSDDVYRYVWEGALVLEGESPYAHAPKDPSRARERERWSELYGLINHPEVSAAYPPLTQGVCALGVWAAGGTDGLDGGGWRRAVFSLRLLFALSDLAVLLPLGLLLRSTGKPLTLLVAWAWCPLVALESGGAPHFDAVGVLCLMAGLALGARGRWKSSMAWLAAGTLVKWLPLMAAPLVGRERGRTPSAVLLCLLGVALGFSAVLPLAGGAGGLLGGLGEYAFRWESFNVVFRWIEGPLREHLPLDEGWRDARRVARLIIMVPFAVAALWLWWRRVSAPCAVGILLALFVVLTPTLHPWYLLWITPFLALCPSPAFLWLLTTAPLTYWPLGRWQSEGLWIEPAWLWPTVALPFLVLLAIEVLWWRYRTFRFEDR